ncbi:hypothetical protein N7507_003279 [Penicillium longicatenatum]|nr:hypothetical protein N7507_003279 [Penicillium longicatenatum]
MQPVVIIGGGPVGLVSSILLSLQNIPHILFERHPSTSIHPKACGLNQRTIEIFRHIGIEAEVLKESAPRNTYTRTAWYTGFGPNGREIHSRDAWGGGKYEAAFASASPSPYVILPQIRLEPILQRRALKLNPDGLKYGSEVLGIDEKDDHVIVSVRRADGVAYETEARYVLGADGGRAVTDWLGIQWQGEKEMFDMVSAHFRAPLSRHHPDPMVFISWFINPATGGSIKSGYLYHLGPYPSNPETEEWCFGCAMLPEDPERFDPKSTIERIRRTLSIVDLDIDLQSVSHWFVTSIVAERFRSETGYVFLVGDAAHRIPPWGALGLNTGIQEAFNLIWKLGFVLRGHVKTPEALLDTYDQERRPIAQRVAKSSLHNLKSHGGAMDRAVGLSTDQTHEENQQAIDVCLDPDHSDNPRVRAAIEKAQKVLDSEFGAHGAEIGWFYPSADIDNEGERTNHDGQIKLDGTLDDLSYHPSTIPGHHLPHAWLQRESSISSTRDLLDTHRFTLITESVAEWEWISQHSCPIKIEIVNDLEGWTDRDGTWRKLCGVSQRGAVLVRPDGIVAWRGDDRDVKLSSILDGFDFPDKTFTASL